MREFDMRGRGPLLWSRGEHHRIRYYVARPPWWRNGSTYVLMVVDAL